MTREELEKRIKEMISLQVAIPIEEISSNMDFINDLNFDSLDVVEIAMMLEDEFGITIKDEDADRLTTLSVVVDFIEEKIKESRED